LPKPTTTPHIGVLAIQGDYEAHAAALEESGAIPSLVKDASGLLRLDGKSIDGLILPGGESTTMLKFLERNHFFEALQAFARQNPIFGTCAGAILLAGEVRNPSQRSLAVLDIAVERNAYGRQNDSTILMLQTSLPALDVSAGEPLEAVFIRAPRIVRTGPGVDILAERDGFPVLVRQGRVMAATFHPELSADRRVHRYFVDLVRAEILQTSRPDTEPGTEPQATSAAD
jgi:5'-phosphate synthase pdxT subunit